MIVIPPLKHNKTVQVDIPKPSTLFKRSGQSTGTRYSGDAYLKDMSKIETAQAVMREADKVAKETPDAELGIKNE